MGKRDVQRRIDSVVSAAYTGTVSVGTGGGGGLVSHDYSYHTGTIPDAHAPQFLKHDGTRAMSASLNMGGFDISNVALVDGEDVSVLGTRLTTMESRQILAGAGLTRTGTTLGAGNITLDVALASPSGLAVTADTLAIDDSIAGNGLSIAAKVLSIATGRGLEIASDAVRVDEDFAFDWNARHTWGGTTGVVISSAYKTVSANWGTVPDGTFNAAIRAKAATTTDITLYLKQIASQAAPILRIEDTAGDALILLTQAGDLESGNPGFVSGLTGWQISAFGNAEFNNITARGELHATIFSADEIHASGGTLAVSTASKIGDPTTGTDNVLPAIGSSFTLIVQASYDTGFSYFNDDDIIRGKFMSPPVAGGLDLWDVYLEVNGVPTLVAGSRDLTLGQPGLYRVNCIRRMGGATGIAIPAGVGFVIWSKALAGSGFKGGMWLTSDLAYAPYMDVFTIAHKTGAWSDVPPVITPRVRVGNLDGVLGLPEQWGIAAGTDLSDTNTTARFLVASNLQFKLQNIDWEQWSSGARTVYVTAAGDMKLGTNTSFAASTTFDFVGSTGVLRIGPGTGSVKPSLVWTGTTLEVRNSAEAAVITLDASGNSKFTGIMTIDTGGEIRQGTGTVGTNFNGLRIWQSGSVGRIAGYKSTSTAEQWYAGSDGLLYAGGGAVRLSSHGVDIQAYTLQNPNPINEGEKAIGWWPDFAAIGTGMPAGRIFAASVAGQNFIQLEALNASSAAARPKLWLSQTATLRTFSVSDVDSSTISGSGGSVGVGASGAVLFHGTLVDLNAPTVRSRDFVPAASLTHDIGSSGNYWRKIYVGEIIANTITGSVSLGGQIWQYDTGDMRIRSNAAAARTLYIDNPSGSHSLNVAGTITGTLITATNSLGVTGNINVSGLVDGVDIAAHAIDVNAHHAKSHVLATMAGLGGDHTVSGLAIGSVLKATGATTAAFATLTISDLGDFTEVMQDTIASTLIATDTIEYLYADSFGTLAASIKAASVANSYLTSMAQATIKGRAAGAGTGAPTDLTAAQAIAVIATADGHGSGLDADTTDGVHFRGTAIYQIPLTGDVPYTPTWTSLSAIAGTMMAASGALLGLSNGTAQHQVPVTGASPFTPAWTALSGYAGNGIIWSSSKFAIDLASTSGLEIAANKLAIADATAGNGLTIASKVLAVGAGTLMTVSANAVGLSSGSAQYQVPMTGANPYAPVWTALSTLAGAGLTWSTSALAVDPAYAFTWTGAHTFEATMTTRDLLPQLTDTYDIGSFQKWYKQQFVSQINAAIFAEYTAQLLGGWFIVPKYSGLTGAHITEIDTNVDLGIDILAGVVVLGDHLVIRSHDASGLPQTEYMKITAHVGGTVWTVERDEAVMHVLNDPAWPQGTPFMLIGQSGDGRIELNAFDTPRLSVIKMTGVGYNDQTEYIRLGDLNGMPGVAGPMWGIYIGDPSSYLRYDPTGGLVIAADGSGMTNINGGNISATSSLAIGGTTYGTAGIQIQYNAGTPRAYIGNGTNRHFTFDGTNISWQGANASLSAAGNLTATGGTIGGWTLTPTTLHNTSIILDAANKRMSIGDSTAFGTTGMQFQYNGGAPQAYIGNGTDRYFRFVGSSISFKSPFTELTTGGNLIATSVDLSGSINATSGALVNLGISGALTMGTGGVIRAGATAFLTGTGFIIEHNAGTPRFRIGSIVTGALVRGISWDGTNFVWKSDNSEISAAGTLTAVNANISGTLTATAGTIGGWTASPNGLTLGAIALKSVEGSVTVGTTGTAFAGIFKGTAANDVVFWAGQTAANRASAPFQVALDGGIKATDGLIGGWTLTASTLVSGAISLNSTAGAQRIEVISGASTHGGISAPTVATGNVVFWAGTTYANRGIAPFRVDYTGVATATSLTTNVVRAASGLPIEIRTADDITRLSIGASGISAFPRGVLYLGDSSIWTESTFLNLGQGRSGLGDNFIDLYATGSALGLRIARYQTVNGDSHIENYGKGVFRLRAEQRTTTAIADRLTIYNGGIIAMGDTADTPPTTAIPAMRLRTQAGKTLAAATNYLLPDGNYLLFAINNSGGSSAGYIIGQHSNGTRYISMLYQGGNVTVNSESWDGSSGGSEGLSVFLSGNEIYLRNKNSTTRGVHLIMHGASTSLDYV